MVFTLIYVSDSRITVFGDAAKAEMRCIEKQAQFHNELCGVSGMLFYYHGRFLQILQGEFDGVISIFDKIKNDPRHDGVRVIWFSNTEHRSFEQWKMLYSMEYIANNYRALTVQPSTLVQFIPKEGHLTREAYVMLMSVATQTNDDLDAANHT